MPEFSKKAATKVTALVLSFLLVNQSVSYASPVSQAVTGAGTLQVEPLVFTPDTGAIQRLSFSYLYQKLTKEEFDPENHNLPRLEKIVTEIIAEINNIHELHNVPSDLLKITGSAAEGEIIIQVGTLAVYRYYNPKMASGDIWDRFPGYHLYEQESLEEPGADPLKGAEYLAKQILVSEEVLEEALIKSEDRYFALYPENGEWKTVDSNVSKAKIVTIGKRPLNNPIIVCKKGVKDAHAFESNLAALLLEKYFLAKNKYNTSHVTVPVKHAEGDGYLYLYETGKTIFPWERASIGEDSLPETMFTQLEEWGIFDAAFSEAGFEMGRDITEADDGRMSKNIVVREDSLGSFEKGLIGSNWKRIDYDHESLPVNADKLSKFVQDNKQDLETVLGGEYRLLELLALKKKTLTTGLPRDLKKELRRSIYMYTETVVVGLLEEDRGTDGIIPDEETVDTTSEKAVAERALEERNKTNRSNYPVDIKEEDAALFEAARKLRVPIYSEQDKTYYVWDADGVEEVIETQYKNGINDEILTSIITIDEDGIPQSRLGEGGQVFGLNFRKDRQDQWANAAKNPKFDGFEVPDEAKKMGLTAMTQYVPDIAKEDVILGDIKVKNGLVEVLDSEGVKMIYVFSAEKGKFIPAFRGGTKTPFANEDVEFGSVSMPVILTLEQREQFKPDVFVPLEEGKCVGWFYGNVPKGLKQIPNKEYRKYPGLSMLVLAAANVGKIKNAEPGTVGLTNLDGPDLIGHVAAKNVEKITELFVQKPDGTFEITKGNGWESVLACLKIADQSIKMIYDAIEEKEGVLVIVGDHGSVDDMTQPSHSFNDVPVFVIDFKNRDIKLVKAQGDKKDTQADVAATILHVLGIEKPEGDITGKSLLPDDYVGSKDRVVWQIILDGFGHTDFKDRNNAFGVALGTGRMPTIKGLYDENNYAVLKASGYYAGLRGGLQEGFRSEELFDRDAMIKRVRELKTAKVRIVYYDYAGIPGAEMLYDYEEGLYELGKSPFLDDADFAIVSSSDNVPFPDSEIVVYRLDKSQMGSTEYNTWSLGAGRVVEQSIRVIDKAFISGELSKNPALMKHTEAAKELGYVHFVGILQEAGVHASARHLYYLIKHCKENGIDRFVFDLASDGREEDKQAALMRVTQLRAALEYFGVTDYVINIRGREICFDRAKNWDLTGGWLHELLWGSRIDRKESYKKAVKARTDTAQKVDKKTMPIGAGLAEMEMTKRGGTDGSENTSGEIGGRVIDEKKRVLESADKAVNGLVNALIESADKGKRPILALDMETGIRNEAFESLQRIMMAVSGIKKNNDELKKFLENVTIMTGCGDDLAERIQKKIDKKKDGADPKDVIVIAMHDNAKYFEALEAKGATLATIDDSKLDTYNNAYYPVVEVILFTVGKYIGWEPARLLEFYNTIPNVVYSEDLSAEEYMNLFQDYTGRLVMRLIPDATAFDTKELKEIMDAIRTMLTRA